MQGTGGFPGLFTSAVTIVCCANLGSEEEKGLPAGTGAGPAKIEELVSRGTAFCEFCSNPSKAMNRKVLSLWLGKPTSPPYWYRLSEFFTGWPCAFNENGPPGWSAWVKANGSCASIASLRKKLKTLPCTLLVPDFEMMLMEAPLAPPRSAP